MKKGITAMKDIAYDGYLGKRLPQDVLWQRMMNVVDNELTERQRHILLGVYMEERTMDSLAEELGINKSTVCRTLRRAKARLRMYLKY